MITFANTMFWEYDPLLSGDIASRLGGFSDVDGDGEEERDRLRGDV